MGESILLPRCFVAVAVLNIFNEPLNHYRNYLGNYVYAHSSPVFIDFCKRGSRSFAA